MVAATCVSAPAAESRARTVSVQCWMADETTIYLVMTPLGGLGNQLPTAYNHVSYTMYKTVVHWFENYFLFFFSAERHLSSSVVLLMETSLQKYCVLECWTIQLVIGLYLPVPGYSTDRTLVKLCIHRETVYLPVPARSARVQWTGNSL